VGAIQERVDIDQWVKTLNPAPQKEKKGNGEKSFTDLVPRFKKKKTFIEPRMSYV